MPSKKNENTLTSEERLIVNWWQRFFEHIREDLAYVWDDESKADIENMEYHAEKVIAILERLMAHYSKNQKRYSNAIRNLEFFCAYLRKIKPTKSWVVEVHDDLFNAISELEDLKRVEQAGRRNFLRKVAGLALVTGSTLKTAEAQPVIQMYLSPRNNKRARRNRTLFIILHTTEAGDRSSLNSIHRSGTANYVVATGGTIYNTVEHNRIAKHAGRSMWNNITNISNVSVGIEVVGYHNRDITSRQYTALRGLLLFLKSTYRLSDNTILTHSMVAYGTPNRYWRRSHRGRKRCGMQFAKPEVRGKLGLLSKPARDPDLTAKRLI